MRTHGYQSFSELSTTESSQHYTIQQADRNTGFLILTPHGGGIEPGASELTKALAGEDLSFYCFEGVRKDGNDRLHITSTQFDEPAGLALISRADIVIAVHGCGDRRKKVYVGGLYTELMDIFIRSFCEAGFDAEIGRGSISGKSPRNICNRGKQHKGVQFEVCEGLRKEMFRGLDRAGRKHTTEVFEQFIAAGKSVLTSAGFD